MKLLLKISYLGGAYCGYQVQPNGITVQQKLNEATRALFGFDCDIVGCSRTDSGVHAKEFCATVAQKGTDMLEPAIPIERIPQALSAHLPEDICIYDAKAVSAEFHARYDVKEKEYNYLFYDRVVRDPFLVGRAYHIPRRLDQDALCNMNRAAKSLIGTHDFSAYMAQGSKVTSTVRTVTHAEVIRDGEEIVFRIAANGFLYNMVRILAGTLLDVGLGKIKAEDIEVITASCDRTRAGATMPACGLYLNRVQY